MFIHIIYVNFVDSTWI